MTSVVRDLVAGIPALILVIWCWRGDEPECERCAARRAALGCELDARYFRGRRGDHAPVRVSTRRVRGSR